MPFEIKQLSAEDLALMRKLLLCFGAVFDEPHTYLERQPDDEYLQRLLAGDSFIALVAMADGEVIGGLAAYELKKFEQKRSEIHIYDLAVYENYRRQGVATALINGVQPIARERGAWVIFIQADWGDIAPINLYTKLGRPEKIMHFDILIKKANPR